MYIYLSAGKVKSISNIRHLKQRKELFFFYKTHILFFFLIMTLGTFSHCPSDTFYLIYVFMWLSLYCVQYKLLLGSDYSPINFCTERGLNPGLLPRDPLDQPALQFFLYKYFFIFEITKNFSLLKPFENF